MQADNGLLLQRQRHDIVQQVMESLRDAGVVLPSPGGRVRPGLATSGSPTRRLEQNLQSLVTHSLAESGLDFPHVQRTPLAKSNLRSESTLQGPTQLAGVERSPSNRKAVIIVSRPEGPFTEERDAGAQGVALVENSHDSEETMRSAQPRQSHLTRRPRALQQSPLVTSVRSRKAERRRRKEPLDATLRTRNAKTSDVTRGGNSDGDDTYARSKIDAKTLAILERSKALLRQTKNEGHTRDSGEAGGRNFVERMRELRFTRVEDPPMQAQAKDCDPAKRSPGHQTPEAAASESEIVPQSSDSDVSSSQPLESARQSAEDQLQTGSPVKDATPSVARCDIDLLRPPERSPENEDEWENELARQILTIYTTSVMAKAAGVNSSSAASVQSRSIADGAPGSARPQTGTPSKAAAGVVRTKGVWSMASSCSLPALRPKSDAASRARSTASVHYSWEPSQRLEDGKVVINMPNVPRPIWFAGTGAVKAVWCALAQNFPGLRVQPSDEGGTSNEGRPSSLLAMCEHRLCEEVRRMEAKMQFGQCIATLESLLVSLVRARGVGAFGAKLWKQLVVTCNAFASRCIDYKKFPAALQLIQQAEQLVHNSIVLVDDPARLELLAFLYDTYAHYYYRKRKPHAGLQYMRKAYEIHAKQTNWAHLAKCRLHLASLLSFQRQHQDAVAHLASILALIERNKLEDGGGDGASAQKICLAAVCYNNLAVEQLHLRAFEAASVSSANAKRLARLCLSYSNRWLAQFEATSSCVALAIVTLMEDMNAARAAPAVATVTSTR